MPQDAKVTTEHEAANGAITTLRDIAKVLKEVGDENVKLKARADELFGENERIERESAELAGEAERLESWTTAIADFERGILDRDELFAKTIRDR